MKKPIDLSKYAGSGKDIEKAAKSFSNMLHSNKTASFAKFAKKNNFDWVFRFFLKDGTSYDVCWRGPMYYQQFRAKYFNICTIQSYVAKGREVKGNGLVKSLPTWVNGLIRSNDLPNDFRQVFAYRTKDIAVPTKQISVSYGQPTFHTFHTVWDSKHGFDIYALKGYLDTDLGQEIYGLDSEHIDGQSD